MTKEQDKITEGSKMKCNHCGMVIDRGLFSWVNHSYECKAAATVPINAMFSATYTPYSSFTMIPDDEPKQLPIQ